MKIPEYPEKCQVVTDPNYSGPEPKVPRCGHPLAGFPCPKHGVAHWLGPNSDKIPPGAYARGEVKLEVTCTSQPIDSLRDEKGWKELWFSRLANVTCHECREKAGQVVSYEFDLVEEDDC